MLSRRRRVRVQLPARNWSSCCCQPYVDGQGIQGRGVSQDDLLQDGVVGVLRAVERYEPEKGPFEPWARLWVRQALQQAVAESFRPLRLPTHVLWDLHELKEARERFTSAPGREPSIAELADALGWSIERRARCSGPNVRRRRSKRRPISWSSRSRTTHTTR